MLPEDRASPQAQLDAPDFLTDPQKTLLISVAAPFEEAAGLAIGSRAGIGLKLRKLRGGVD
jgi:hypothetical protein